MTHQPSVTPIDGDLATLDSFTAASDAAAEIMAAGIGAMLLIAQVCLAQVFLAQVAFEPDPVVRRRLRPRTVFTVVGCALAAPAIAGLFAAVTWHARAPDHIDRAQLCERLYPTLTTDRADPGTVDRVLNACPDHRAALRRLLLARD